MRENGTQKSCFRINPKLVCVARATCCHQCTGAQFRHSRIGAKRYPVEALAGFRLGWRESNRPIVIATRKFPKFAFRVGHDKTRIFDFGTIRHKVAFRFTRSASAKN